MISTSATVFAQYPEVTVPRLARRFVSRYESIRMPDNRIVLHMPSVGTVVMAEMESALRLQYIARDASMDFAARTALEEVLRRELRRVVYTIAWEESKTVPAPLR
ncbi:hypothetical protein ACFFGH_29490 [Lysobacter korlensis]|uniref:DUF2218 domain-containing protein n=1 Tax=Lysobacter korlensis TaxID=553636 RepID=A0ABV6RYC7_9GAMM